MALVIESPDTSTAQEDVKVSRPEPTPTHSSPSAEGHSAVGFGRSFLLATLTAVAVIVTTTVLVWWLYRGEFWPGVGLAAYLAFWFAPAAGLIGGGTYWTTKNPLH